MLNGRYGPAIAKAMEIVTALGNIYQAEDLVEVSSVNVSGVSYTNLGEHGIQFLNEWAEMGAKVTVPTTLNPAGMDLQNWKEHGISEEFAEKQEQVIRAFSSMGIPGTCTCTPYLIGNRPAYKSHIAWGESSAVCYANSVLGARTNREGGPSALAAAICGRTARYGYHLDQNRLANTMVDVKVPMKNTSDYGALGQIVGKQIGNGVPYFRNLKASDLQLKALGASLAAWGGVALFHVDDLTPEAIDDNMVGNSIKTIQIDSLAQPYLDMNDDEGTIDIVSIGCPHASVEELNTVAEMVRGKILSADLWVTTARKTKDVAPDAVRIIECSGGHVVADACLVVAPIKSIGYKHLATNSAKMAFYSPSYCGTTVRYGTIDQCIQAAIEGRWVG